MRGEGVHRLEPYLGHNWAETRQTGGCAHELERYFNDIDVRSFILYGARQSNFALRPRLAVPAGRLVATAIAKHRARPPRNMPRPASGKRLLALAP